MKSDPEIEIKIGSTLDAAALDDAQSKMDALGQSAEDAGQKGQQQAKSVITAAPRQVSALNAVTKAWGAMAGAIGKFFGALGLINQVWELCRKIVEWWNRAKVERQEKLAAAMERQAKTACTTGIEHQED